MPVGEISLVGVFFPGAVFSASSSLTVGPVGTFSVRARLASTTLLTLHATGIQEGNRRPQHSQRGFLFVSVNLLVGISEASRGPVFADTPTLYLSAVSTPDSLRPGQTNSPRASRLWRGDRVLRGLEIGMFVLLTGGGHARHQG